jgi:hypothetical protein
MPYEEIQTEKYKFTDFEQTDSGISFNVVTIEENDVTEDDREEIEAFLNDLGKWESLVKAGLNLLSELKIVQVEEITLQNYQKEFGSEKYRVNVQRGRFGRHLRVNVYLSIEERHRRAGTGDSSVLQVQEIYDQLKNIPKWRAFRKAMQLIRGNTT